MVLKLGTSVVTSFAPSPFRVVFAASTRTMTGATKVAVPPPLSSTTAIHVENPNKLSIAILGGGVAGLSCASQLLSQHKKSYDHSSYRLEVTVFDTGRLRPGGRCLSRLPGDVPAPANKGSGGGPKIDVPAMSMKVQMTAIFLGCKSHKIIKRR